MMRITTQIKQRSTQLCTPLYRNAFYIMANQFLLLGAGLAFWLLAANHYTDREVGVGSATVSAMLMLSYLSLLGLDYTIIRFLPGAGGNANRLINACLSIGTIASIAMAMIFVGGIPFWSPALLFFHTNPLYPAGFVLFTAAWTAYWIAGRTFIAMRRAGLTLAQGIIFNFARLGLVVVLAAVLDRFGILASWGLGGTLAVLVGVLCFVPGVHSGYRPLPGLALDIMRPLLRFAMANYVLALLWFGTIYILPLMVINIRGEEEAAYFFIAWQLANILFSISIAISFSLFAEGSHNQERLHRDTLRSLKLTFGIMLPAVATVFFFGEVMLSVYGSDYADQGADFLKVASLSAIPVSVNQVYFGVKRVEMQMKIIVAINGLTAFGTIVSSALLLPSMGIMGVGVGWLVVHTLAMMVVLSMWLPDMVKGRCRD